MLLSTLGINAPTTFKGLRTLLRKRASTHLTPAAHTLCPHCGNISNETTKCTSCNADYAPILPSNISLFYTYNITKQLEAVLAKSQDIVLQDDKTLRKDILKDITDGYAYKKLLQEESEPFITLTMNVDGVQSNKTLITLFGQSYLL